MQRGCKYRNELVVMVTNLKVCLEQTFKFLQVWKQSIRNFHEPALDERPESDIARFQVNHAATGYRGRGSHRQIGNLHDRGIKCSCIWNFVLWRERSNLKHHCHMITQFNDFSTAETKLFVVIKYGVHVFNPNCINRSIKHIPAKIVV